MSLFDRLRGRRSVPDGPPAPYPLNRTNERRFPDGYEGDLFVWDIDKTYLVSEFDSLRGLLAFPIEQAVDKRAIPGADVLLRGVRRGVGGVTHSNPLYFVSASPPQLRSVIERKMLLDGVEYDGITFKDHLKLIRQGRVGVITHQVAYKLAALLLNRHELPWGVREHLFGDDSESDALIYALYSDILAGRLRGDALESTLRHNEVDSEDARYIRSLSDGLPEKALVASIYIHLEKRRAVSTFSEYGGGLLPCYDAFQTALHLRSKGLITPEAVIAVGQDLAGRYGCSSVSMARNAFDLVERGALAASDLAAVWPKLQAAALVPTWVAIDGDAGDERPTKSGHDGDFVTPIDRLAL